MKIFYKGINIEDLSREELLKVIVEMTILHKQRIDNLNKIINLNADTVLIT